MATGCSPSPWQQENDAKIRHTKLSRLLIDGGTHTLRCLFDAIYQPLILKDFLNKKKKVLQKLKKPRGKVLSEEQWDKLYPPSRSDPNSQDFDVTLLFTLLRNICGLQPPLTAAGVRGWDKLPQATDNSQAANIVRIKCYRNKIAHLVNTEISEADFKQYWKDISNILLALGLQQDDIDELESKRLGEEDYNKLLKEWCQSDQEIAKQLEDLKSTATDIKSTTTNIENFTKDLNANLTVFRDQMIVNTTTAKNQSQKIAKLHKDEFRSLIKSLCKSYHHGTRRWILDKVKDLLGNEENGTRVLLIEAEPGLGKSTVAGKICEIYNNESRLGACHFFQLSNSTRNNPRLMLQSIARQLCGSVCGYREALEEKLQTSIAKDLTTFSCEELFTVLLEEPLHNDRFVDVEGTVKVVIVLDAIEECCSDLKLELEVVLKEKLSLLPSWLKLVITTRPSTRLDLNVQVNRVVIDPNCEENRLDIENFYNAELKKFNCPANDNLWNVNKLVKMSHGIFLIARFIIDCLQNENIDSSSNILKVLSYGMTSEYERYCEHLKVALLPFTTEKRFFKMLEAIVAAEDPIPLSMIYSILGLKSEHDVPPQDRKKRHQALKSLYSLFPVDNDHVFVFHKTFVYWLGLNGDKGHGFSVYVEEGKRVLASQCSDALNDIQKGGKDLHKPLELTHSERFALTSGWGYWSKHEQDEILRNHFVLSALVCSNLTERHFKDSIQVFKADKLELYTSVNLFEPGIHDHHCPFRHPSNFGCCVEFLLSADLAIEMSKETPREGVSDNFIRLQKHDLSYYETKRTELLPRASLDHTTRSYPSVLLCEKDFVVLVDEDEGKLYLQVLKLDGTSLAEMDLPARHVCLSPDSRMIIVNEVRRWKREITVRDSRTLKLVFSHKYSAYEIKSCNVCGEKPWFILANCSDGRIRVIEGLGHIRHVIPIGDGYEIEATSRFGQMLVRESEFHENTYKKESIVWLPPDSNHSLCTLYSCNANNISEVNLAISPIEEINCNCSMEFGSSADTDKPAVCFSQDGKLIARHIKGSIFIHKTSDGAHYKNVLLGLSRCSSILLLTSKYVVIYDSKSDVQDEQFIPEIFYFAGVLSVINIHTNEVAHRFFVPYKWNDVKLHVVPRQQGEPFTLMGYNIADKSIIQFTFQNVEL